jgi:hypothetical protein
VRSVPRNSFVNFGFGGGMSMHVTAACAAALGTLSAVCGLAWLVAIFGSQHYSDRAMRLLRRPPVEGQVPLTLGCGTKVDDTRDTPMAQGGCDGFGTPPGGT